MDTELLEDYLADRSRVGPPLDAGFDGAAGGAACGDLIRVSVAIEAGAIAAVSFEAEGCAPSRAAGAAAAEAIDGASVLEAARLGAEEIAERLGGVSSQGWHAVELAADAVARALSAAAGAGLALASAPGGGERVLVAFSGGVDSTVAALLERERGAEVVAVTLKLWADRRTDGAKSCCSPVAVLGARRLARSLGVPHLTLDLEDDFRRRVVGDFIDGYRAGRTPNPCVICNGELRIDAMIALADRVGASALATGHYARLVDDGAGPLLRAAADSAKDQSYMLSALRPESLARLRFPLAERTKPEVRAIAAAAGLPVASKRESQDLCFLAGEGKRSFLARNAGLAERPGDVIDRRGRRLGRHRGHHEYTVGQRRGLGISSPEPLYVLGTDANTNTVIVGGREQLASRRVSVRDATLLRPSGRVDRVRLRYHSEPLPCRLGPAGPGDHDSLRIELAEPAYGVAPGQTACLLDGDLVVGRATIA